MTPSMTKSSSLCVVFFLFTLPPYLLLLNYIVTYADKHINFNDESGEFICLDEYVMLTFSEKALTS